MRKYSIDNRQITYHIRSKKITLAISVGSVLLSACFVYLSTDLYLPAHKQTNHSSTFSSLHSWVRFADTKTLERSHKHARLRNIILQQQQQQRNKHKLTFVCWQMRAKEENHKL